MAKVGGLFVALAIFGGIWWYRSAQADKVDAEVDLTIMRVAQVIVDSEAYAKHREFFDAEMDRADDMAMADAYTPGGRRRSPSFDPAAYRQVFFGHLKRAATMKHPDKRELELALRQLELEAEKP